MKAKVIKFKNLTVALKELEPFVKDGKHLQTGRPFKSFDLRSREILANWLVSAALNFQVGTEQYTFTSDPDGGDGRLYDSIGNISFPTEHIIIPQGSGGEDFDTQILDAVKKKNEIGEAYASGKTLVVFMNETSGPYFPNKIAKALPNPLHFEQVWLVGLDHLETDSYHYNVVLLEPDHGNVPIWRVVIPTDFGSWSVSRFQ